MNILYALIFFLFPCLLSADLVLVTVAPHKFFVDQITQNTIPVQLMVPAGASAHTYEPTPKQILSATQGDIWFTIGEGFEQKAERALLSYNPQLQIVDLRQGVNLILDGEHSRACHCRGSEDLHYWLSFREAKTQAKTMYEALLKRYPTKEATFSQGYQNFLARLDELDSEISTLLKNTRGKTVLVAHPAYSYFTRDYGLNQRSIEIEGKDPTPVQLTEILRFARNAQVTKVFVQPQYPSKGASLIANQIGAKVVVLEPYSENYFESMRQIANEFAQP